MVQKNRGTDIAEVVIIIKIIMIIIKIIIVIIIMIIIKKGEVVVAAAAVVVKEQVEEKVLVVVAVEVIVTNLTSKNTCSYCINLCNQCNFISICKQIFDVSIELLTRSSVELVGDVVVVQYIEKAKGKKIVALIMMIVEGFYFAAI